MKLRTRIGKDGTPSFFIDYRLDGIRKYHFLKNIHDRKTADIAFSEFKVRMSREEAALPSDRNQSLSICLGVYKSSKEATCSQGHIKHLKAYIAQMESHFGKDTPIRALNEESANGFRATLKAEGDCPATINRKMNHLKAAIGLSVKRGKIARNGLQGLQNLSDTRKPAWRFLSADEAESLLSVLRDGKEVVQQRKNGRQCTWQHLGRNPRLRELVLFLLNTGARMGEAMALTWRDIDLERKTVCLHTTKKAARGRSAKPRFVPLNQALLEMLKAMAERRKADREKPKGEPKPEGESEPEGERKEGKGSESPDRVFTISPYNLKRAFEKVCKHAGIGHCRFHDLRHTFASGLAMAGIPLNTIRELLGHTSLVMTLRYAHLCPNVKAEAVEALNFGAQGRIAKVVSMGENAG